MDDSLTVHGGGSTAVATDELLADAARLGGAEAVLADWSERVGVVRRVLAELSLSEPTAGWADQSSPNWAVAAAGQRLREAEAEAGHLRRALTESAERYGATERAVDALWQLGGAQLAYLLGATAPMWVGAALLAAGPVIAARTFGWRTPLGDLLGRQRNIISDPWFVRAVRTAADSFDEFVFGAFHVPGAVALGSAIDAPESASVLLGAAGLLGVVTGSTVLVDGPVRVRRAMPEGAVAQALGPRGARTAPPPGEQVEAPDGLADLVERIPPSDPGPQIRIERYGDADDPRWAVYISGTVDFSVVAGAETNDMTNDVYGIADDSPLDDRRLAGPESGAGERAVRQALVEAGASPGDPILPIGYSGGGVVAAALAGDPELNVIAAMSVGAPVASAELREGVPLLSVEHDEDLVPATGGWGKPSPERLTVTRSVLDPGTEYAGVPAHELGRYRQTAALIDASEAPQLVEFREKVAEFTGDGTGEMTRWIGTRDVSSSMTVAPRDR